MKSKLILGLALVLGGVAAIWLLEKVHFKISIVRGPGQLTSTNYTTYDYRAALEGKKGELDKALTDLTTAIRLNPKDDYAYARRGLILALKGKYDQALTNMNEAIRLNPNEAEYYADRAGIDAFKNDFHGEISDCSQAIKLDPNVADYYARRGAGYVDLGEYDQAIDDFNQAIKLNPVLAVAFAMRGAVYGEKGEVDRAISDFSEVIRLNPKDEKAHLSRAMLFIKKQDMDAAISDLGEVIRLDPGSEKAYGTRGLVYLSKHDFDRAISDYTALLKLDPTNSAAYANRSAAYWLRGDYPKAVADCKMVTLLSPGDPANWNKLAQMLATSPDSTVRDGKNAVAPARKACQLSKWKKPPFIATLAAAYAEAGDYQEAIKYQKQAMAMPGWPSTTVKVMHQRLELYQQGQSYHELPFSENPSGQNYRVKSNVEKSGQTYRYVWTVENRDQSWGLDQFAVEVPVEMHVLAHTVPPPYSSSGGNAKWTMTETREAQVDPHDGRAWLPAARPGRKWILWSGQQSPSVYPPGTTAKFSLTTDATVKPGTVHEVSTTYTPQNNPHYYRSFRGKVTGPAALSTRQVRSEDAATTQTQSQANEPASMITTNVTSALTNSVLLEIDEAATYLKELKKQGQLPGVPKASHFTTTTGQQPASELKELRYPFVTTFLATLAGDSFTNHYTVMQPAKAAPCQLERAWRTDSQGRTTKEWPVATVPMLRANAPLQDLANLAAMQKEMSSHQAMRGPLMRELRAAAKFLTELGRSGRLPGKFAHHGHEQVSTGTLPFKEVNYPFAVTFRVNEDGESLTNHYTLVQSAKDVPWQLQRAWRTDAEGHTIEEWQVK